MSIVAKDVDWLKYKWQVQKQIQLDFRQDPNNKPWKEKESHCSIREQKSMSVNKKPWKNKTSTGDVLKQML